MKKISYIFLHFAVLCLLFTTPFVKAEEMAEEDEIFIKDDLMQKRLEDAMESFSGDSAFGNEGDALSLTAHLEQVRAHCRENPHHAQCIEYRKGRVKRFCSENPFDKKCEEKRNKFFKKVLKAQNACKSEGQEKKCKGMLSGLAAQQQRF
jgi:hypothetical protein